MRFFLYNERPYTSQIINEDSRRTTIRMYRKSLGNRVCAITIEWASGVTRTIRVEHLFLPRNECKLMINWTAHSGMKINRKNNFSFNFYFYENKNFISLFDADDALSDKLSLKLY